MFGRIFQREEPFVIKYEITGREDGRWVIQAFDKNHNRLGTSVSVNNPVDAWRVFMMLNGYSDLEPTQILHEMEKVS